MEVGWGEGGGAGGEEVEEIGIDIYYKILFLKICYVSIIPDPSLPGCELDDVLSIPFLLSLCISYLSCCSHKISQRNQREELLIFAYRSRRKSRWTDLEVVGYSPSSDRKQ